MPDINLDSLFIIGLILASLIGKIFNKKETQEKENTNSVKEDSESLEDAIKDAWKLVTNPKQSTDIPPPLPEVLKPNVSAVEDETAIPKKGLVKTEQPVSVISQDIDLDNAWNSSAKKRIRKNETSFRKNLFSKRKLKSAIIINEILEKPISIRPNNQNL